MPLFFTSHHAIQLLIVMTLMQIAMHGPIYIKFWAYVQFFQKRMIFENLGQNSKLAH
jgi:hypothetical protein